MTGSQRERTNGDVSKGTSRGGVDTACRVAVSGGEGFGSSRFVSSLGPKFTKFDDWEPLTRQDAVAARKGESEGLAAATSFKANAEDLKVDVFGNVAIATFVMNYTIEAAGTVTAARARSTVAFARDQTGWKIIHEHHSAFKSNP